MTFFLVQSEALTIAANVIYKNGMLEDFLKADWRNSGSIWETNCAIYFWIFCVNLYIRYQLNCTCFLFLPQLYMYVLVIAYFHCVQFKSSHLLDGLFSYLQGSVMMTDYLYKNVVTLFSVFSMRERERSREIKRCFQHTIRKLLSHNPPPPSQEKNP